MIHIGDRAFHLLLGALLLVSLASDQQEWAGWRTGRVGIVTLALAMVWLWTNALEGFRRRDEAARVLHNRLADAEQRLDELAQRDRARRAPPL
ncbi:MAG: hypothetical protein H6837_09210 [Planctomycetes bacterium]|nr:hypothetical protein [Planctomycetota bacterium]